MPIKTNIYIHTHTHTPSYQITQLLSIKLTKTIKIIKQKNLENKTNIACNFFVNLKIQNYDSYFYFLIIKYDNLMNLISVIYQC